MDDTPPAMPPPVTRSRAILILDHPMLRVYDDEVLMPDGNPGSHMRVLPGRRAGEDLRTVVALGRDAALRTAFVRIYRYGLGLWQLELPRGLAEPGESDVEAACRELFEETGLRGNGARDVGGFAPDSGLLSMRASVVAIEDLTGDELPQSSESISEVIWLDRAGINRAMTSGELSDGVSLAALAVAGALRA